VERRQQLAGLWLALLLALLGGCGGGLPGVGPDEERRQATVDGVTITLDTRREPLVNEAQPFTVTLTDRLGRPIDGADVALDLDMEMLCLGGAAPIADPAGRGRYTLTSAYQMAGDWSVTVEARVGEARHKAAFTIAVADPAP
jgi:hypothetical protein